MKFGVYIHIPYCLQRCTYCDFATYEQSKIMPPEDYFSLLRKEISIFAPPLGPREIDTIYFGGGTPSLVKPELIVSVLNELSKAGLKTRPNAEITLEINPATLSEDKMRVYFDAGINRFSVGAQTFDDKLLKSVNREHNVKQTLETLEFLKSKNCNYTFDLLFALPGQKIEGLEKDLEIVKSFNPKHISAYCLTVPESHPLAKVRLPENEQIEMFNLVSNRLDEIGILRYEISNFAVPGFESQHNLLYWTDEPYVSFGLSSHSYLKPPLISSKSGLKWGVRYWNPSNINDYAKWISSLPSNPSQAISARIEDFYEELELNQSLTDYLHTSFRMMRGLNFTSLVDKFGDSVANKTKVQIKELEADGLVSATSHGWTLSDKGLLLSNQVFSKLTFLKSDL